ncbi:MAG: response regulator transcription factor [bacterium]
MKDPNYKILVVDDDINVQEMLKESLQEYGYSVSTESSAINALNIAEKVPFDLFIIDVMMPDIDGISLCKSVRNMKSCERIPIIMLTALSDSETMEDAMMCGAVDYVVKPFDIEALKEKIKFAIHQSRQKKPI